MRSRLVALGGFVVLLAAPAADAQVKVDFAKITCREFVTSKFVRSKPVAYWLSGYYNGKNGNTAIDIQSLEQRVYKLEIHCRHHYDMTVLDVARNVLGVDK